MGSPGNESIERERPASAAGGSSERFTLDLTLEEIGFLRLLVTNATVQPAELKKLCGEVQSKIESQIGPLPPAA